MQTLAMQRATVSRRSSREGAQEAAEEYAHSALLAAEWPPRTLATHNWRPIITPKVSAATFRRP